MPALRSDRKRPTIRLTLDRLRRQQHEGKKKYCAKTARAVAERLRGEGVPVFSYLCNFPDDDEKEHWHVGHYPSMEALEEMALVLRERDLGVTLRHRSDEPPHRKAC
jgi:hypothetical protein